jgi:ribonucleoside-diphosphate reductase beta chain
MAKLTDTGRGTRSDDETFAGGYFRNAVYRHWDPDEIDLAGDREELLAHEDGFSGDEFDMLRLGIARFGGGEEAVTEDLMPLAMALEGTDEQMFLTTQLYEEAKHTRFFDRYWEEVLTPLAEELGVEVTEPTDERYLNDDYVALFDAVEDATTALLDDQSPEALARAYAHYHVVAESVLAQTAYYSLQSAFSPTAGDDVVDRPREELPDLDGLVEGIARIRSDEGRHVGFGMHEVQRLISEEGVDEAVVRDVLTELMPHVAGIFADIEGPVDHGAIVEYAQGKLTRRLEIVTDEDGDVPPVEELVAIEGAEEGSGSGADGDGGGVA